MEETFGEMLDTSPDQRRRYYEWLRTLTPQQRALEMNDMHEGGRSLACAGIQARNHGAAPREIEHQLAERLYGRRIAARFFDPP